MENEKRFESVYSTKVRAGRRRTYFFDVRQTKGNDYYITLTESTKRFNGEGYDRHKIFLYKEDFNRFLSNLQDVIDHVKTELMPDYDYEEYERRQEEWEAQRAAEEEAAKNQPETEATTSDDSTAEAESPETDEKDNEAENTSEVESDDDMAW